MDIYKKSIIRNLTLFMMFVTGVVLQFVGHRNESYEGLGIQFISLAILITVIAIYNNRYK